MTITRSIAFICFIFLWLTTLSGQSGDTPPDSINVQQQLLLQEESAVPDTLNGTLVVPNVFSPNGDLVNDYFEVATNGTTVYKFSVFTRTGTRIYYTVSPRIFWDGNSVGGKELPEGVYYYVIEEEGGTDPFEKGGFVHLFR